MKKKPRKVEESAAPYTGKKPAAGTAPKAGAPRQIRYATPEQVRKAAEKVFKVHHELFRKLAQ